VSPLSAASDSVYETLDTVGWRRRESYRNKRNTLIYFQSFSSIHNSDANVTEQDDRRRRPSVREVELLGRRLHVFVPAATEVDQQRVVTACFGQLRGQRERVCGL